LIETQLRLEGIGIDAAGQLVPIPDDEPIEIPRLYVAQHAGGYSRFYRADLDPRIRVRLAALATETIFYDQGLVEMILADQASSGGIWVGASYVIVSPPAREECPDVVCLGEAERDALARFDRELLSIQRPIFAIVVGGQIASTCVSTRESGEAAEAWVQTAPSFRRQGFARQVTAAWAHDVLTRGKVAFYSHRHDNLASRKVAECLGMTRFVDAVGYL
jgi:hypothetical protein